ncbi:MAG TPA: DUF4389 domain-containing protein [Gaiellales bacterium]|jgi:hypothetical protein|nr:DUF4389 domain-containing protein [Gaiellales bacterium]
MAYPIHTRIEHVPKQSRLATFFRIFLLIPHGIVLFFYGIASIVVTIISWFVILFIGRLPRGMFNFQVGFLRYNVRVRCYASLLTGRFPPFGAGSVTDGYPVQVDADYPERLSRLTTFFRYFLSIPAYILLYLLTLLEAVMAFFAWWVILFIGRLPEGMFEVMELPQRYNSRVTAYLVLLITDAYPWFQDETEPDPEPWTAPAA